jgi:hypothetical protein
MTLKVFLYRLIRYIRTWDFPTKNTTSITLERIKQIIQFKKATLENKLRELNIKQASIEPLFPSAKEPKKHHRELESITYEIKKLEAKQEQLQKIDFIFRNALSKQTFDAYLKGQEVVEKLQLSPDNSGRLSALAQEIQACKADLEKQEREL